jgi:cytoskeletal protein RodZ
MADGNKDTALGLGERLRSARKARALTLEQAAFSIRLEAAVLRALEDERYEALGAAVFVRGHLKAYARLLGLSEEAVLAAYRAADPNADAPPKVSRELEKPLTTAPGPAAIGLAVFIAIVAMLLLYLFGGGKEPVRQAVPTQDSSPTVEIVPTLPAVPSAPVVPSVPAVTSPPALPTVDAAAEATPAEVAEPAPAEISEPAPAASFE